MSIYNTGIPTMPMYDVTKREFGEMMTPQDQIMWLYCHQSQEASVDYVDSENAKQDETLDAYKRQMIVALDSLKREILKEVDIATEYGELWSCQLGYQVPQKEAMRLVHKDMCAMYGMSVKELGEQTGITVEILAESGLNVYGMATALKRYASENDIITYGASVSAGYPY